MPPNRPPETPLAVGALIALYRAPLLVALVLLALGGCVGCGLLAYSLGAQPEYTVTWRTGSAAVSVSGCVVKAGWWDEAARVGDSGEWRVC